MGKTTNNKAALEDEDRLPGLLIIGAAKAGTTSLHYYLNQHPEISMSWPKETNFFTRQHYMESLDWYRACFPNGAGLRGEASPAYANYPRQEHIPQRISSLLPDVRLIYLVRDPVERAESHYYHRYLNRTESRPIDDAFAAIDSVDDHPYITASRYGLQLEQYLACFSMSQILIVDNRDLKQDRESTMRSVFSFVDVDPTLAPDSFDREIKVRATSVRASRAAARIGLSAPARIGRVLLPVPVREPLFAIARRALSPRGALTPTRLSPEMRERVAGFFEDDAARLRELTGLAFSHWSV